MGKTDYQKVITISVQDFSLAWLEEENAEWRAEWQVIEEQEFFTGLDQYRPQLDQS